MVACFPFSLFPSLSVLFSNVQSIALEQPHEIRKPHLLKGAIGTENYSHDLNVMQVCLTHVSVN